ncbi:hypothetical protein [Minwuia sp.]|uniref:hypothetical protein n=1 Tax=Minwuia sp. TaxID=2493630 RepID=UPI003A8CC73C
MTGDQPTPEQLHFIRNGGSRTIADFVADRMVPIGFVAFDQSRPNYIANGTMVPVEVPNRVGFLTARHVLDGLERLKTEHPSFQILAADTKIDLDRELCIRAPDGGDICLLMFQNWGEILSRSSKTAVRPDRISEGRIFEGQRLDYAGFPGLERRSVIVTGTLHVEHGIYSVSSLVKSVGELDFSLNVEHEFLVQWAAGPSLKPGYDVGGMSGGPAFVWQEDGKFVVPMLAGIVSEGISAFNMIKFVRVNEFYSYVVEKLSQPR